MDEKKYLTTEQLSERWGGTPAPGTLKNWRLQGKGVRFIKMGNMVKYPLSAILRFEKRINGSSRRKSGPRR